MAKPAVGRYTQEWYDQLEPLQFDELTYDYALLKLIAAMGGQFQEIDDIVQDTDDGPGWSAILDYTRAPAKFLPWLGQLSGTVVSGALTEAEQRIRISDAAGIKRGRISSLIAAAQVFLTGNKTVKVQERFGSAYRITVTTYKSETPVEDWPTTNLVANGNFEASTTGWTGEGATLTRDTTTSKIGAASAKLVATSTMNRMYSPNVLTLGPAGTQYTISGWLKAGNPAAVGKMGEILLWNITDSAVVMIQDKPLTSEWQFFSVTGTVAAGMAGDPGWIYIGAQGGTAAIGDVIFIDGIQLEMQPKATPYVDGSRPTGQGLVGRALLSQKAAGLVMTYNVIEGQTYQDVYNDYATYQTVYTTYDTYLELLQDQP